MNTDENHVEEIASGIANAISDVSDDLAQRLDAAEQVNAALTDAAIESERTRRIAKLEDNFASWQNETNNQISELSNTTSTLAEATAAMALAMEWMEGALLQVQSMPAPPNPELPPNENIPNAETAEAPEPMLPEVKPDAPARKRRRWI